MARICTLDAGYAGKEAQVGRVMRSIMCSTLLARLRTARRAGAGALANVKERDCSQVQLLVAQLALAPTTMHF